ncbi:putative disease resistance RPP13-like protein 1 [Vitis vinifera]|uniref:Putative disease resistance RPP13-like protein 1 n=1 Tax=Vitis vinifera TaxID=29760 RepID=A0A438J6H1_VITVI|nr:putative disease resistance RPP13-like protein 1 [Vitis vinifera]
MAGALVGGAFLSASLQVLFDRLASREVVSFIRGQKLSDALLKKLERKLLVVHAVLNDAEVKQFTNPYVKKWLVLLREAVYDAEDILDEIATEALRHKVEAAESQTSTSQVGNIMDMSTWVLAPFDGQGIESRVEEIIDRLEDMARDRDVLRLKEGDGEKLSQRWPSTSLVDESLVYIRDQIKEEMVQLLLSDNARSTDAMGVISIVGMGGTGKTTLAQLLYNDQRVTEHFDLKAWVCVSEEFDPIRVTKTILEAINSSTSNTTDLNLLQVQLKERINMKKFLLVLDDVWNEDSCDWDALRTPLIVGAKGSKIIVTTRSTNVAFAMHAVRTHCLGGLSSEDGWSLFKKLAFESGDSSGHPQLEAIGEKIVHKCQGLPLAIKAMGSLLHSKVEAREWDDVLNSELWDLPTNAVLPALRMEKLINLRYLDIRYTSSVKEMPSEICKLKNLQSLSTFIVGQNGGLRLGALRELSGSLVISKLQNVVCDRDALEANMKDKKYLDELKFEWDNENTDVGVVQNRRDILSSLQPHTNLKRLHINSFSGLSFPAWVGDPSFFNLVDLGLQNCNNCSSLPPLGQLPSLKHLSILQMKGVQMVGSEFYGNASSSNTIKPSFPSLQTLRFERMYNWEKWLCCGCRRGEFPRLQQLCINECPKLTGKLPKQLRSLKKLEISSSELVVGSLRAPQISERKMGYHGKFRLKRPAGGFTDLQTSEIEISDISQLEELPPRIQTLRIRECDSIEWVLEEGMLQGSTCLLQHLHITSCRFSRPLHSVGLPTTLNRNSFSLSFSLSIFPRLTHLHILEFEGLAFLSISISEGDPTSLNRLDIRKCPDLVYIELPALESAHNYIFRCRKLKLLAHTHSSLQELRLIDCPELWFQKDGLPSDLREVEISSCNQLTSQVDWGLQRLASLTKFTISGGCQDMESFPKESLLPSTLSSLNIYGLPNLKSLDSKGLQQLTSLTTLSISDCPKFQSFGEEGLQHLTSLEKLKMDSLPELESLREVGLQHLTSLKKLSISNCQRLQCLTKERLPNSLSRLKIKSCPLLEHGCQFEKGQDWEYIAHIPRIVIEESSQSTPKFWSLGTVLFQSCQVQSPNTQTFKMLLPMVITHCANQLSRNKDIKNEQTFLPRLYEVEMCDILYLTRKKQVVGNERWHEEGSALSVPKNLTGIGQVWSSLNEVALYWFGSQHFTRDGVCCASACIKNEGRYVKLLHFLYAIDKFAQALSSRVPNLQDMIKYFFNWNFPEHYISASPLTIPHESPSLTGAESFCKGA